jgi:single-strand DNA-binding protein
MCAHGLFIAVHFMCKEFIMSRSLNKAMLIGNVGSDPEIRSIPSGARVANFSLATSKRWKDRNGQLQEKTEWHRVVVWDKPYNPVDFIEKFVKKGDKVYVEGEIDYRSWEDKDGNTRYTTEIMSREVSLLVKAEGGDRVPVGAGAKKADYDDFDAGGPEDEGDDLPF